MTKNIAATATLSRQAAKQLPTFAFGPKGLNPEQRNALAQRRKTLFTLLSAQTAGIINNPLTLANATQISCDVWMGMRKPSASELQHLHQTTVISVGEAKCRLDSNAKDSIRWFIDSIPVSLQETAPPITKTKISSFAPVPFDLIDAPAADIKADYQAQRETMLMVRDIMLNLLETQMGMITDAQSLAVISGVSALVWEGWRPPHKSELRKMRFPALDDATQSLVEQFFSLIPMPLRVPQYWQSAEMLDKRYEGCDWDINIKLHELRKALITQYMRHASCTHDDAQCYVAERYVGIYKPKNGLPALYASPAAVELLEERNILLPRTQSLPTPPDHWLPASLIRKQYEGRNGSVKTKLLAFREEMILKHMQKEGCPRDAADTYVTEHYAGMYTFKGCTTLYISPAALLMLENEDKLIPKPHEDKLHPGKPYGVRSAYLKNYFNLADHHHVKLDALENTIAQQVGHRDSNLIKAIRSVNNHGDDEFYSSDFLREAIIAGILDPKDSTRWQDALTERKEHNAKGIAK